MPGVSKVLQKAKEVTDSISEILSFGAKISLCALVGLVAYSAFSRYVLLKAVHFMAETGGLLLMSIGFLSFAYVFTIGGHIKLTILTDKLPQRIRSWLEVVMSLLSLAYFIIFIKLSLDFVYTSYLADCHSVDAHLYEVPWMALMPIGIIIFAIVVLVFCIDKAHSALTTVKEKGKEEVVIGGM